MATITMKLQPFTVPNFVSVESAVAKREDGPKFDAGIPIDQVSAEALDELCREFRDAVFAKAKKQQPPRSACGECGK